MPFNWRAGRRNENLVKLQIHDKTKALLDWSSDQTNERDSRLLQSLWEKNASETRLSHKKQVERLTHLPYLGKVETDYQGTASFRSLIEGDYKIVYLIKGEYIYIVAIFDCRQNPSNLYKMLKL